VRLLAVEELEWPADVADRGAEVDSVEVLVFASARLLTVRLALAVALGVGVDVGVASLGAPRLVSRVDEALVSAAASASAPASTLAPVATAAGGCSGVAAAYSTRRRRPPL
jgi:hypothetical protein